MNKYLKLLRIKHYLKNTLIFLPIVFGKAVTDVHILGSTIYAFLVFCLSASVVYIINDINDVDKDRLHPTKCKRPIASGEITIKQAKLFLSIVIGIICLLSIIAVVSSMYSVFAILLMLFYVILNLLYSKGLKNIPVLDVTILASGFLIRIYYGSSVSQIPVSSWLYLTVLGGAFYLGMGKRRNELSNSTKEINTRSVLKKYNYAFLDKNMHVCVAFTEMAYALWAAQSPYPILIWTVPIVMIIFMKYSLVIESEDEEGNPMDVLLKSKGMMLLVFLYLVVTIISIYLF